MKNPLSDESRCKYHHNFHPCALCIQIARKSTGDAIDKMRVLKLLDLLSLWAENAVKSNVLPPEFCSSIKREIAEARGIVAEYNS